MRGRGIAGVARQPVLPVGFRQVRSHLLSSFVSRIIYRSRGGKTLLWRNPIVGNRKVYARSSSLGTFRTPPPDRSAASVPAGAEK